MMLDLREYVYREERKEINAHRHISEHMLRDESLYMFFVLVPYLVLYRIHTEIR